jgi:hypothetical protein
MVADVELAPSPEIHSHLVQRLGDVLRRPGTYGDAEFAAQVLIDVLLVVEQRPEVLTEQQRRWDAQGAWTPLGVGGAFQAALPAPHAIPAMSVYAEFARGRGWLRADRLFDDEAYGTLRRRLVGWTAQDRYWPDVRAEFGPPSLLLGGRNPAEPKALCYVPADPAHPVVTFHLWNADGSGLAQPVLLAVRVGGEGPFGEQFSFTPEGRRRWDG